MLSDGRIVLLSSPYILLSLLILSWAHLLPSKACRVVRTEQSGWKGILHSKNLVHAEQGDGDRRGL